MGMGKMDQNMSDRSQNTYPSTQNAIHRILDYAGNITEHIPNQLKKLEAEGIQVINETYISLQNYQWDYPIIYLN
jgi:alkylated DNA nucleotide flippase Atl1